MRSRSMNSAGVTANFGSAASVMLSTIAPFMRRPFLAAVLGDEGDAASDALSRRMAARPGRSPTTISPESCPSRPKRMRASSVRPEPIRPKTPSTSPLCRLNVTSLMMPVARERLCREEHARLRRGVARRIELLDRPADHQRDHARDVEVGLRAGSDQLPVAQHGDIVGKRDHVRQNVGDVDHRLAGLAQSSDQREEALGFACGQRRRRLVEDDDLGIELERARGLDQLALAGRKAVERRVRGEIEAHLLEQLACSRREACAVDQRQRSDATARESPSEKCSRRSSDW